MDLSTSPAWKALYDLHASESNCRRTLEKLTMANLTLAALIRKARPEEEGLIDGLADILDIFSAAGEDQLNHNPVQLPEWEAREQLLWDAVRSPQRTA